VPTFAAIWVALALLVASTATGSGPAAAKDIRVALVIGEGHYSTVGELKNPPHDADSIAAALQEVGFQVDLEHDLTRDQMVARLQEFEGRAENADWSIIYFAGHGVEDASANYLIPVDARILSDSAVQDETISVNRTVRALGTRARMRILFLDACRENRFRDTIPRFTRAVSYRGLAPVDPANGAVIEYAAQAGAVALDGEENSPFAQAIVTRLRQPGLEVGKFFRLIRDDVVAATKGAQEPAFYGSLGAVDSYFVPPTLENRPNDDDVAWNIVRHTSDADPLQAFIAAFPQSPWRPAALVKLSKLRDQQLLQSASLLVTADVSKPTFTKRSLSRQPITISCGWKNSIELEFCKSGVAAWQKTTGISVSIAEPPVDWDDRIAQYKTALAQVNPTFDVVQIDVTWPATFTDELLDLRPWLLGKNEEFLPQYVDSDAINGKVLALPWFADVGLIFYRKDLLDKYHVQTPNSWKELRSVASLIQSEERSRGVDIHGLVFPAKATESTTTVTLELINSFGGGTILDQSGQVTLNNPRAVEALSTAASWISDITPVDILTFDNEDARKYFQGGRAVFMINWPYTLPLANEPTSPLRNKVGVMPIPPGGPSGNRSGTLGGWQLAVVKNSRNPAAAVSLVQFLTSLKEQKRRAIFGGFNPAIGALYRDPEVLRSHKLFDDMYASIGNAVARPSGIARGKYDTISRMIWDATRRILSNSASPEAELAELSSAITGVLRQ
jgi:trehalose/maltose transport system substrate-binding protein